MKKQFKWNQLTILTMTNAYYEANYFIPCLRDVLFCIKIPILISEIQFPPYKGLGEQLVENCSSRPILSIGRSLLLEIHED